MPQAMLTTASTWGATSTSSSTNSHSHCRSSVLVRTLIVRPSFLSAICNRGARVSTSRSPPAAHSATQVAHPATRTLVCSRNLSTSSGKGFHSAMIIFSPPSWDRPITTWNRTRRSSLSLLSQRTLPASGLHASNSAYRAWFDFCSIIVRQPCSTAHGIGSQYLQWSKPALCQLKEILLQKIFTPLQGQTLSAHAGFVQQRPHI